jgi:hypothetical protein
LEQALCLSSLEPEAALIPANGGPLDSALLLGSPLFVALFPRSPSSAHGKSPAMSPTSCKDTNPKLSARRGSSSLPSVPGGDSSLFCGLSAKPSIITTAASEVTKSVPPKDGPAVPSTDDKDTNPKPSARSGNFPSPLAPGGDSSMLRGSSARLSIASTAASEVGLGSFQLQEWPLEVSKLPRKFSNRSRNVPEGSFLETPLSRRRRPTPEAVRPRPRHPNRAP